MDLVFILENNSVYHAKFTGLPALSSPKYNLYLSPIKVSKKKDNQAINHPLMKAISKRSHNYLLKNPEKLNLMMNIFPNICDGKSTTLDIAIYLKLPFDIIHEYSKMWANKNLLKANWVNSLLNDPK